MKALKSMKGLKIVMVVVALACILPALSVQDSQAAVSPGWYACTVVQTGTSYNSYFAQITDNSGAFANEWVLLNPSTGNQMLATTLTALSTGLKVYLYYDGTQVLTLYLLNV
jgi:hypothetical protein